MYWSNALSTLPSLEAALKEVVEQAQAKLRSAQLQASLVGQSQGSSGSLPAVLTVSTMEATRPNLAILFVSSAFASEYSRVMPLLQSLLDVDVVIGCSGDGVAGEGHEVEDGPAISLTLATLPRVSIQPFHATADDIPDLDGPPDTWADLVGVPPAEDPDFILLSDGFTSNVPDLLEGLDFAYPGAVKVGGLASSGRMSGGNALFLGQHTTEGPEFRMLRGGTIGIALSGEIIVEAAVAQGCRPIGAPMQVSKAQRNVILELDDQPPLEALQRIVLTLPPEEQQLVRHSLFIGLLMDEFKQHPEQGDYLIRVILWIDPKSGAIAIGDRIRPGQTVQFHLRDADASSEDLRSVLRRHRESLPNVTATPAGALMFACLGRGENLYGQPDFDTRVARDILGDLPLGGFFCNGEIGPVGGTTFLHGYTSSFGLFRAP